MSTRPKRKVVGTRTTTRSTGGWKERVKVDIVATLETCPCGKEFYRIEEATNPYCAHCQAEDPDKRG